MQTHIEKVFQGPGPRPNGLQGSEDGLLVIDQETNEIQRVNESGEVSMTLRTESQVSSGVAASESYLWAASNGSREILKLDPQTGQTLKAFPTPGPVRGGVHGIEWAEGALWVTHLAARKLTQVDEEDFQTIHSIPAPGPRGHGLAWDNGFLWCVDTTRRAIYKLCPKDGSMVETIEIPDPNPEPHGLTLWNGALWYCDAESSWVCRLDVKR